MKKHLLRALVVLLVLLAGGLVALQVWLSSQISRDRLVAEMEKGWNCRAELAASKVGIFRAPARVELAGLRLAPRDTEAGKRLPDRAPLDPSLALLTAGRIELAVSLTDFLWRRASIRRLHIDGFTLRDERGDDEDTLLDILFSHPDDWAWEEDAPAGPPPARKPAAKPGAACEDEPCAGEAAPAPPAAPQAASSAGDIEKPKLRRKKRTKPRDHKPFKASDLKIALGAEEASVEHARIDLIDRPRRTHTVFDNVRLVLRNLDVAPDDLRNHNRCDLELAAEIKIDDQGAGRPLVNCALGGSGYIRPFDAETGLWNTDLTVALTVRRGSLLGGTLIQEQMREKDAAKLREYGIDLGTVALGGILGQDATTKVHYGNGKLIVKQDTRLVFPQYEIAVMDGSWFHGKADLHIVRGELVVGAELSATILAQAQKLLAEKYGETLAVLAIKAVQAVLMDDDKRMIIKFKSKGKVSKPEVTWDNPLNDLKDLLKSAGTSVLESLLGK